MFNHHHRLSILIGTCIVIGIGYYALHTLLYNTDIHQQTDSILNLSVNFLCTSLQYFLFLSFEYSFLWYFFYVLRSARQAKNKYCRLNSSINARKSNQKTKTTNKLCKDEWRKRHTYDSFTYIYTHIYMHIAIFLYLLTKY